MSATTDTGQARRYWVSILAAGAAGLGVTSALMLGGAITSDMLTATIVYYMVTWILFCATYLTWTHRHWTGTDLTQLRPSSRQGRGWWWGSSAGLAQPEWWSIQAGVVSAFIVIAVSSLQILDAHLWLPALGLLNVAGSWGLMVYAYAEKYLDLHLRGEHIDLPADPTPEFGDFLSHSVAVSTMTGAAARARATRTAMRLHSLVAFGFNTVIVAMTVSLLFS
ncbi:MAG: DUF1345 domain-containing protein [Corynebacterium sp.]|uniref:DUF1345 domain-containing protein n=1 Tax=Corynebacterium sp. TaxID=1720 RepID=UPI0026DFCCEE|nr:DUF1345 domain-containing protein [Corynebacterium sp.]MDO5670773.1 DUF1345 domain-containing protein [Corynebacterium sp.]